MKNSNWESMSDLGRYLTAKNLLEKEGNYARIIGSIKGNKNLYVVEVSTYELNEIKLRFPYINITNK